MEVLKIKGMSCQHCVGSVEKALQKLSGLSDISVNLEKGEATYSNSGVPQDEIRATISKIGFDPGE